MIDLHDFLRRFSNLCVIFIDESFHLRCTVIPKNKLNLYQKLQFAIIENQPHGVIQPFATIFVWTCKSFTYNFLQLVISQQALSVS